MAQPLKLFVSYARVDQARVAPLVDTLGAAGFDVWWDRGLAGGAAFVQETEAALTGADAVIVCWSQASIASDWVRDEAQSGQERGRLVPLLIDPVRPPLGFRQTQYIDLSGWNGRTDAPAFQSVLAAVARVAGAPAAPRPARPAAPAPRRIDRRWLIGGGLGAAAVAAAGGLALSPGLRCRAGFGCPAPASATSIAVLPFANLSGDAAQDYFAAGLAEELLASLARIDRLQVAARTSAARFAPGPARPDTASIGRQLGVAYLLDGSVRRAGNRVRVSAQLVEAATGFERWSDTYEQELSDLFAVETRIAQAVAGALSIRLLGPDIAALSRGGTQNPAAWDAYVRAGRLFDQGAGEAGYRAALQRYDAAIAADPAFAAAHAGRARAMLAIANQFVSGPALAATYDDALASARRAVALAPALADAQTTLALVLIYGRRDFAGARAAFDVALKAGAGEAPTLSRYGQFAMMVGDFDGALTSLGKVVRLDPLNPRAWKQLGLARIAARQFDGAIAAQRRALELSPGTGNSRAEIAKALYLKGDLQPALAELALEPVDWERLTGEAIVRHRLGDRPAASAALARLVATSGDSSAFQEAQVQAQWGDAEAALAALRRALKAGDPGVVNVRADPLLDPLRPLPAFRALVASAGLPA